MFIIIAALLAVSSVSQAAAENLYGFFDPALNWIQRWLPLFYVPTLVVLPLSIQGIAGKLVANVNFVSPQICR